MRPAGGNHATLKKYVERWGISTAHFDPHAARAEHLKALGRGRMAPLEDVLVENSSYSRGSLKRRLYDAGLKERQCELCGQGEMWRGRRMALILDHVNGVGDDNRLANLRIVCPNCAATLDTHCGRNAARVCPSCRKSFHPKRGPQRFCSSACRGVSKRGVQRPKSRPRPETGEHNVEGQPWRVRRRKVERPPYEQLIAEIEASGYCAVGRKYGVSDNAIRKWVRQYRRERVRRYVVVGRITRPPVVLRPG